MRILHVIPTLAVETGGPAKACVEMAEAIARRGHRVAVASVNWTNKTGRPVFGTGRETTERGGVRLEYFPVAWPRRWLRARGLDRFLATEVPEADLVHIHSLYLFPGYAAARACRRAGVPYLLRPHGTLDPYIRQQGRVKKAVMNLLFQDQAIRQAAALHFTSEEEMRLAAPASRGRPGVVVPNGIEAIVYDDLPAPGGLRRAHPEIGERRILLFLGRLTEKKGLDILVPAFAEAERRRGDLHLVLAGPDEGMRPAVEGWLEEHGVSARASFTGMLGGEDKLAAFADAELFVLPSYSENFGIAVVEAMACGCPVLISDRVNIWREIAADGAGFVCPPDREALVEALDSALADRDELRRRGAAGRQAARQRYDWQVVAPQLEAVYARLAGGRPTAS